MKLPENAQMRQADQYTINTIGIPGIVLMEKAAEQIAFYISSELKNTGGKTVLFVCGKGNNGGDGFAAARILLGKGIYSEIMLLADKSQITGDAKINLDIAEKLGIKIFDLADCDLVEKIREFDLVADGIFGTGFSGEVKEPYKTVINAINENAKYVLSVDIPSGVSGDTGEISGTAVNADTTVTLACPKPGLFLFPGRLNTGKLFTADIGIPDFVIDSLGVKFNALTISEAKEILPKRKARSHKGTYGKLFVIAGSETMAGAAYFTTKAAYETGSGLVYSCIPKDILPVIQTLIPEAVEIIADNTESFLSRLEEADCAVIGPGLGKGNYQKELILDSLEKFKDKPVLIDADGLNNLAKNLSALKDRSIPAIITPHPAEMMRLTGISTREILKDTVNTAVNFAKEYNTVVVLKDSATIIASPEGEIYINTTGNSALAKGGSGDVLSGIIGGLLSQGLPPFEAAYLGVFIHGMTGDIARDEKGARSVSASYLCDSIYKALMRIENS
ncbi:MAG: NAD(P)H-hydrate dehydratase [Firmicutes bacterium]|nr:NAD(P)H-hydrate dehydratase [Bacillota bacterium]